MAEIKRNNVKDFNAKGDGKTDDTLAIQNAIDDLYRSPIDGDSSLFKEGGIVYFPAGKYIVSKPIYITKAGISLEGQTATASVIVPMGTLQNRKLYFDGKLEGNAVIDFVYYSGAGQTGTRSFIRNIGMKNLSFDLINIDKTTVLRLLRPYDLCIFESLIFKNIRSTAIEAISEYPDNTEPAVKGLGQGVILRDIHIDNSSTILDSLKDGKYVTFNKLLDKGRPQDATSPVIHFENINESSLTNVKIIACGSDADEEGNVIRENGAPKIAHAMRNGVLTEGCQGITIKESAFTLLSKPAIQIQRGTFGKQQTGLFHFIQGNTFEELTGGGIKIDGGAEPFETPGRKGVSEVTISENRFLGNTTSQYFYIVDNCDLVTIRDRCSLFIGAGAINTTVYAIDTNKSATETKIQDNGKKSIIMGRKYNFTDGTDAYIFSTRLIPERLSIPVLKKAELQSEKSQKIEGDIVLAQIDGLSSHLVILKRWQDGSLRWVNMKDELIFTVELISIDDFYATATTIKGSYKGIENIAQLRLTARYNNRQEVTSILGGTLNMDGTFEFYILGKGIDLLDCSQLLLDAVDREGNSLNSIEVPILFNENITVNPYSFKDQYITGTYSSLIKSIKLISTKVTNGGTLTNGTFKFYAIGNMDKTVSCFIVGYDANGHERVRSIVPIID
ncbi:hypothetical protein HCB27_12380 [Listeria booriae]|uniref:Pectate lyase superfamily protein domain-containing protein n=1 Tax=Listeria booriae TaxID=1552123 RepID=A0A7X0Z7J8_9LIST|nr:glycosyl hydrolase family 28-related protein [Listeria booriae]MBC2177421.1 hypothetical protein [Listeria booriae]